MGAYGAFWRNYFNFSGRSTRSEFWWPYIINIVIVAVLGMLAGTQSSHWWTAPFGIATVVFGLLIIIPMWSLIVRRVRDTDVEHVVVWSIVAIIFDIVSFVFGFIPTKQFGNR